MYRRALQALLLLLPLAGAAQTLDEAQALQQRGALREARSIYQALLPRIREREPASAGTVLNGLSQIATAQGDYQVAVDRAHEALRIFRRLGDGAGEIRALNNAGAAEVYRGGHDAALRLFRQALDLARARRDDEAEVDELNNIGSVCYLQATYLSALGAYRDALERADRSPSQPWSARKRSITLANLAALFQRLGQDERALEIHSELRKGSTRLAPSEQARLLTNLGVLYRRLGDPVKALETYQAALAILSRDRHHDAQIGALKNVGIVQALDLGNLPAARQAFASALALAETTGNRREAMQAHLYLGEVLLRQREIAAARRALESALSAAREMGTAEEAWKALYGLGRAARAEGHDGVAAVRFREAIAGIESVRARLQLPALRTDFLADKRDVYDALVELTLPARDAAAIFDLIERSRARTFQDRLSQSPPALAAVQARLDSRTLLVEFWVGPRIAAAIWVTADEAGVVPFAAPAADVDELVRQLQQPGDGWRRLAGAVGERLVGGIAALSGRRIRHVLAVPDGPLAQLPLEALVVGGDLLVERFDVSYLPTAAILLRDPPRRGWTLPWKRQLLAFADPHVSGPRERSVADAVGGMELQTPLPASAEEARAIARSCRGRAQLHLGSDDLKSYLLGGAAAGVPLLHMATHATADMSSPERSRILFSPASPADRADYLFLKEVYSLDLEGVDLATLSACETERGKAVPGEGVQAFSRALLSAGARAAVTTLWRIGDEPAREFMQQLYYELSRGIPKAEALREAKLRLLQSRTDLRHPRFWAPFVLTGEGLRPIPPLMPWSALLGAAGAVALGGAMAMRLRIRTRRRQGANEGLRASRVTALALEHASEPQRARLLADLTAASMSFRGGTPVPP